MRWSVLSELPDDVFQQWQKTGGSLNPSSVLASINEDGSPRTAPFGSLRAISPKLLRLLVHKSHDTLANIVRDNRIMIALVSPPNTAASVKGIARVIQHEWEGDRRYALIEIEVLEVKNDMPVQIKIESGISISPSGPFQDWWNGVWPEFENI
ncbi:MAG: pyridoxamine 5'-phosphate oxidase family protein [Candidatus Thorarchaeota archaeon]